jgi:Undecaprenyl-phosphate glucose phosphotransferase
MDPVELEKRFTKDAVKATPSEPDFDRVADLSERAKLIAGQIRSENISPVMVAGLLRLAEVLTVLVLGTGLFVYYIGIQSHLALAYATAIGTAAALTVVAFEFADAYQLRALRQPFRTAGKLLLGWSGVFGTLLVGAFFLKISAEFSRFWFGALYASGFACIFTMRLLISRLVIRWGRNGVMERRALIVGGGKHAETLIRAMERQPDSDIRICGIFDDRDDTRSPPIVAGYPKLGTIPELIAFARTVRLDMLIVAMPLTAESRVLSMLKRLWVLPVDIRLSAHASDLRFRPRAYSFVGSVPMLDIFDKPINDWDSVGKRVFDVVFSLLGIIALSPIMLMAAIAIKLDSKGPVLFKQRRHGFNNEIVEVFKFRSMYTEQCDPSARAAVTKGDPRVTRVGRFIRKTSIDELPQFFNALRGDLSLVGPRPHAVYAQTQDRLYHEVVDGYFARHRVKPGVTGWAQINGWRGEVDVDEKIAKRTEFDLYYIENWSLWFDLKILFLTPIRLMNTENAY